MNNATVNEYTRESGQGTTTTTTVTPAVMKVSKKQQKKQKEEVKVEVKVESRMHQEHLDLIRNILDNVEVDEVDEYEERCYTCEKRQSELRMPLIYMENPRQYFLYCTDCYAKLE
jgi:hypothetical protein